MTEKPKYCGVLTSPESKALLNELRSKIPGMTEAVMMHFFITEALKNTANVDAFIEDMNEEVKIAKGIAEINRKEKYDSMLVTGRQLRAAARTKAPKAPKTPKAKTSKSKPKWSIEVTDIVPPTAEWIPGDES
jgi:ADP-heptose:LPS heptosyltransferase